MHFILRGVESGDGDHFIDFFNVFYVNRHMIDCAGFQRRCFVNRDNTG